MKNSQNYYLLIETDILKTYTISVPFVHFLYSFVKDELQKFIKGCFSQKETLQLSFKFIVGWLFHDAI